MNGVDRPGRVQVRAPGKINLFLGVGPLDGDGYHALSTVFQAVSLYEDVTATSAETFSVTVSGALDPQSVPTDDRNLAVRAAKVLAAVTGHDGGVQLEIRKSVPVAGGMGGGSADAAAALVACNELWRTGLTQDRLHDLGARLGADVPFALTGGTAVGTGRGDVLTPALARGRYEWVLITEADGLSTPEVYRAFDVVRAEQDRAYADSPSERFEVPPSFFEDLLSGDAAQFAPSLRNELEAGAFRLRPPLEHTIAHGVRAGALAGIVSGSGPTVALLCADAAAADLVAERMRARGATALRAHGPVRGAHVVAP